MHMLATRPRKENPRLLHIVGWRSAREVAMAVANGQMEATRKCQRCDCYDFLDENCSFIGKTESSATCNFWSENSN